MSRGFSFIEVIVVCAVIALLAVGGGYSMLVSKKNKELATVVDGVVFTLEEAKGNAVSGKYGSAHGVHFTSSSYVIFSGSSYSVEGEHNRSFTVPAGFQLSSSIAGGGSDVVFVRLTGATAHTGTITITDGGDSSRTRGISIGALGDISIE